MKSLVATAPGKLVLCGEYAVLDGAPAISAAVDRRARVTLRETGRDAGVVVTTMGFRDGEYHFRLTESGLKPTREQGELPLAQAVVANAGLPPGTGLCVELDTAAFFDAGVKLGLGSSAALTVALVNALAAFRGGDKNRPRSYGEMIHSHFQGGRGSGVDIATSAEGGLIRYSRQVRHQSDRTTTYSWVLGRLNWPGGLEAAVLSSGVSASTRGKLSKLDSQDRLPISDALVSAAEHAADAWEGGCADRVLESTGRFAATLADFSRAYHLDVYGAGHEALAGLAAEQGLVYKPCGAGGGDVGIVLGDDANRVEVFVRAATEKGFTRMDCELGGKAEVEGLTIEWTHD